MTWKAPSPVFSWGVVSFADQIAFCYPWKSKLRECMFKRTSEQSSMMMVMMMMMMMMMMMIKALRGIPLDSHEICSSKSHSGLCRAM